MDMVTLKCVVHGFFHPSLAYGFFVVAVFYMKKDVKENKQNAI
jgi:hypothetical protein